MSTCLKSEFWYIILLIAQQKIYQVHALANIISSKMCKEFLSQNDWSTLAMYNGSSKLQKSIFAIACTKLCT